MTYRVEVKNTTILPLEHIAAEALPDGVHLAQPQHGGGHDSVASHEGNTCDIGLNPRYVFEQFIVGKGNELAHAASMAVAAKPGQTYNPLFIYGGVGMGKTHLLQAIGHHLVSQQPQAKVRYVTCERFTNEFIQAVRSGRGADFKETYRTVDLLLIDDIQFLTGKKAHKRSFHLSTPCIRTSRS